MAVQGWLTDRSLVRRTAEAVFKTAGRRNLARFDQLAPARSQTRILLGLLHQAQTTRFGRDHDFRRIRTEEDYRRLAPLCTRAELWRDYWQPVYPHLAGATWPDDDKLKKSLAPCHRAALRTALALFAHARPRTRLLSGTLLFVSDDGPSIWPNPAVLADRLPALLRPFAELGVEVQAERWAALPVTGLIGPVERLLPMLQGVKQARGKRYLHDVWSKLSVILYSRRPGAAVSARLRAEVGDDVLMLEMAGRGEGPIAVEDPRYGLPRLLFDHGVYFEFVPADQVGEPRCPRYGIEEIELGVPYELAVTSPAGLWACRVGRTVCLEQRDPPLVRFLDKAVPSSTAITQKRPARRTDLVLSTALPPEPHPQSGGTPAAPPESSFHTPWSALADRG
jgi:hypothetical protein